MVGRGAAALDRVHVRGQERIYKGIKAVLAERVVYWGSI